MLLNKKISIASSMSLAAVAVFTGLSAFLNIQLSDRALELYDRDLVSVHYAQDAQVNFARLAGRNAPLPLSRARDLGDLDRTVDALDVAMERATTDRERNGADSLRRQVLALRATTNSAPEATYGGVERQMTRLVARFRDDALARRNDADGFGRTLRLAIIVFGCATTVAILILANMLFRSVVRPLRSVVDLVSRGDAEAEQALGARNDEIGQIVRAVTEHRDEEARKILRLELDRQEAQFQGEREANAIQAAALAQARDAAREAEAAKTEFLANMSHEIRTPLTSVIGFTDLVAKQPELASATRTYVTKVGEACRALLSTVNDILDFSKLEAGQVSITPQATLLLTLCQNTLELMAPQADAKAIDLRLEADIDPELTILLDATRLRQILLNLLGNAVKFTDAGGVTLKVGYDRRHSDLTIEVQDTGPGIAPDKLDLLFQRFSQVDSSLTREKGGTGLGLAICRGLISAMGGVIEVESELGRGSCFRLSIAAPVVSGRTAAAVAAKSDLAGVRVLISSHDPVERELARLGLCSVGAEVSEVAAGPETLRLASRQPFDVIVLDAEGDEADCLEILAAIRDRFGPNDVTPILALATEDGERLLRQGFDEVLAKPVAIQALIVAVARAAGLEIATQSLVDDSTKAA